MATGAQQIEQLGRWRRRLLPRSLPEVAGWEWAVHASHSAWPGGDYFDVVPLSAEQWLVFLGDASGHGGAAAVLAAMARMVLHACPLTSERERAPFCPVHGWSQTPSVIMSRLNRVLASNALEEQFMTAFLGQWRPARARFDFVLAGAAPPRIWRQATGQVEAATDCAGLPLGIAPKEVYSVARIVLEPGDAMVIFTDGLVEARNAKGQMFRVHRVDAVLTEQAHDGAEAIRAGLAESVNDFLEGRPAADDVSFLVVKRWE
ncbi:MAG: hypothetical protein FJ303_13080 [Planctomycetes bacterium]|nr:hypothetical protein [Planctomycetota bacterium]